MHGQIEQWQRVISVRICIQYIIQPVLLVKCRLFIGVYLHMLQICRRSNGCILKGHYLSYPKWIIILFVDSWISIWDENSETVIGQDLIKLSQTRIDEWTLQWFKRQYFICNAITSNCIGLSTEINSVITIDNVLKKSFVWLLIQYDEKMYRMCSLIIFVSY